MKSMTGFGTSRSRTAALQIEVGVRSVNGRFLDLRMHLPRDWSVFEADIREIGRKYMLRGTIDVYVQRQLQKQGRRFEVKANPQLAEKWLKEAKKLQKEFQLSGEIGINELLERVPVLEIEQDHEPTESEKKQLLSLCEKAFAACAKERMREGKNLKNHLLGLLQELEVLVSEMDKDRKKANESLERRLKDKVEKRLQGISVDPQRLAQELAFQLEKLDIDEEVVRLKEHIRSYRSFLKMAEVEGKKLDFYTQELLREVNTIGSKSQLASLTQNVVIAKTTIEKMREQVQNVE